MVSQVQFADPAVSRRKFNREISEFRRRSNRYQQRGWFMGHAKYPHVRIVLATRRTNPVMVLMGVAFDYTNYDAAPPSVRMVHPITGTPYKESELPTHLPKLHHTSDLESVPPKIHPQPLMQSYGPDEIPFLCLEGVLEYHQHPAHSGDPWELYRTSGAGSLVRLIELISKYGPDTVNGIGVKMQPEIGFSFDTPPE